VARGCFRLSIETVRELWIPVGASTTSQPQRRAGESAFARLIADMPFADQDGVITLSLQLLDNHRAAICVELRLAIAQHRCERFPGRLAEFPGWEHTAPC